VTHASSTAAGKIAVIIPAWEPSDSLIRFVSALLELSFGSIIVVDDGSGPAFARIFASVAQNPRVHVLRHRANLGKGRALKTALRYSSDHLADAVGAVTCDADGQHHPADVRAIADALQREPGKLILGVRQFAGSIPLRSRLGNVLTRHVFGILSGRMLGDTQSGLRGIPRALIPRLREIEGDRYEYEMNVLADAASTCGIVEVPIRTIYLDGNRASHFRPFRDSMRIYLVLARFCVSSLISAVLDFAIFAIMFWATTSLTTSIVCGRASSIANFLLNRRLVFRAGVRLSDAAVRYYGLAILLAAGSYAGIRLLSRGLGMNVLAAKALVEIALSLASFSVQRSCVFPAWARQ